MRIHVKGNDYNIHIPIPTGMIFSKASAWMWLKIVRKTTAQYVPRRVNEKADAVFSNLSDDAVYALCSEIMRIKRKYGSWDLVEVESSSGDQVLIQL